MILADHYTISGVIHDLLPLLIMSGVGALISILLKLSTLEKVIKNFDIRIWWNKNKFSTILIFVVALATIVCEYSMALQ